MKFKFFILTAMVVNYSFCINLATEDQFQDLKYIHDVVDNINYINCILSENLGLQQANCVDLLVVYQEPEIDLFNDLIQKSISNSDNSCMFQLLKHDNKHAIENLFSIFKSPFDQILTKQENSNDFEQIMCQMYNYMLQFDKCLECNFKEYYLDKQFINTHPFVSQQSINQDLELFHQVFDLAMQDPHQITPILIDNDTPQNHIILDQSPIIKLPQHELPIVNHIHLDEQLPITKQTTDQIPCVDKNPTKTTININLITHPLPQQQINNQPHELIDHKDDKQIIENHDEKIDHEQNIEEHEIHHEQNEIHHEQNEIHHQQFDHSHDEHHQQFDHKHEIHHQQFDHSHDEHDHHDYTDSSIFQSYDHDHENHEQHDEYTSEFTSSKRSESEGLSSEKLKDISEQIKNSIRDHHKVFDVNRNKACNTVYKIKILKEIGIQQVQVKNEMNKLQELFQELDENIKKQQEFEEESKNLEIEMAENKSDSNVLDGMKQELQEKQLNIQNLEDLIFKKENETKEMMNHMQEIKGKLTMKTTEQLHVQKNQQNIADITHQKIQFNDNETKKGSEGEIISVLEPVDETAEVKVDENDEVKVDENDEVKVKVDENDEVKVDENDEVKVDETAEVKVDKTAEVKVDKTAEVKVDETAENLSPEDQEIKKKEEEDEQTKLKQQQETKADNLEELSTPKEDELDADSKTHLDENQENNLNVSEQNENEGDDTNKLSPLEEEQETGIPVPISPTSNSQDLLNQNDLNPAPKNPQTEENNDIANPEEIEITNNSVDDNDKNQQRQLKIQKEVMKSDYYIDSNINKFQLQNEINDLNIDKSKLKYFKSQRNLQLKKLERKNLFLENEDKTEMLKKAIQSQLIMNKIKTLNQNIYGKTHSIEVKKQSIKGRIDNIMNEKINAPRNLWNVENVNYFDLTRYFDEIKSIIMQINKHSHSLSLNQRYLIEIQSKIHQMIIIKESHKFNYLKHVLDLVQKILIRALVKVEFRISFLRQHTMIAGSGIIARKQTINTQNLFKREMDLKMKLKRIKIENTKLENELEKRFDVFNKKRVYLINNQTQVKKTRVNILTKFAGLISSVFILFIQFNLLQI